MSDVDLGALRLDDPEQSPKRSAKAPLGPRITLGLVIVVVVALVATFVVPLLRPAAEVRTAPVRLAGTGDAMRVGRAEAAGWIEPQPFPHQARPLVHGVLESLDVLEGDVVVAGETIIGVLRSAELEAARDRARAAVEMQSAEVEDALAGRDVAKSLLDQQGALRLAESRARGALEMAKAKLVAARGRVDEAVAMKRAAAADLAAQEALAAAGGTHPVALERARAADEAARASLAAREAEVNQAEAALDEATKNLAIELELRREPRRLEGDLKLAETGLKKAEAELGVARTELVIAERELGWATIRAPADGIVQKLEALPGHRVGPTGEPIVTIYDPQKLQARIDVPFASMAAVRAGQEVEIRSEVVGSRVTKGVVLRVQHESDMLKNTLEATVALIDPDPLLRPETLCRARFLASANDGETSTGPRLFRVPTRAVHGDQVFVIDPTDGGRARAISVEVIETDGSDTVVRGELSATHRVILDPVEDGDRVKEVNP